MFCHPLLTQISNSAPYNATVSLIQQMATSCAIPLSDLRIASTPSLAALVSLVNEGLGVAVVPGLLVKNELRSKSLVRLKLPEPKPMLIAQSCYVDARPIISYTSDIVREACIRYAHREDVLGLADLELVPKEP